MGGFLHHSMIKFFKHMWFKSNRQISTDSLTDFIRLGYIPAPSALFERSWMLQPGSFLTINSEFSAHTQQYHIINDKLEFLETDQSTQDRLAHVLDDTFVDYVHSDVPLGSFLSGGVDSPLVNAVLSKLGYKMRTFSISTQHLGVDESEKARKNQQVS